ncbi:MAG: DUF4186 domain-containing protein [Akkermansia sp.]|nr:DUF4186 domain-containing protein [Akkermansia sp.]
MMESLTRLMQSAFRRRFRLSAEDVAYIRRVGWEAIATHAADFVRTRLAPAEPPQDGRQTPMRGHPVFKAQHACACCCRGCLQKWHAIPAGRELSIHEQLQIVALLLQWLREQPLPEPPPQTGSRQGMFEF